MKRYNQIDVHNNFSIVFPSKFTLFVKEFAEHRVLCLWRHNLNEVIVQVSLDEKCRINDNPSRFLLKSAQVYFAVLC